MVNILTSIRRVLLPAINRLGACYCAAYILFAVCHHNLIKFFII